MDAFILTGFFMGGTTFFLGVLLLKYGTNKIHYTFALQNLGIAVWGISNGLVGYAHTPVQAIFWWKIGHIGAFYLIVLLMHHALLINNLKRRLLLFLAYVWATLFPILCIFGQSGIRVKYTYLKYAFVDVYFPVIKTLTFFGYVMIWLLIAVYCVMLIIKAYRNAKEVDRRSLEIYRLAYPIGLFGGASYPFMLLGVNLIYPYSQLLVPMYCALMAYSILRHKLFNMEVIIKNTLIFASLFSIVFGVITGVTLLLQYFFVGSGIFGIVLSCVIIIFLFRPLENFLIKATDKYLFQKKYNYRQVMESFIDDVTTVLDTDKIITSTAELLDKTLHPETIKVLLLDDDEDRYVESKTSFSGGKGPAAAAGMIIEKNSFIPDHLKSSRQIVCIEKINGTKVDKRILYEMKRYAAHLMIPIMTREELIGIMFLGKKRSDEYYTPDDIKILSDLAKTEAIAISNSRTHALLLQSQQKEEQSNRLLSLAYLVTNLSHELRNPLMLISGFARVSIDTINFKTKGLPQDDKYNAILSVILKKQSDIIDTSKKASDMLNTILNSMKIDRAKFTLIDLRNIAHEAIKRAEIDAIPANIILQNHIPHDFVNIKGDHITLEQVFFNLIHNAIEAMLRSGKGDKVEVKSVDIGKKVKIFVTDNGPGIAKQDMERIFEPFYTTKDNLYKYASGQSKGAGLGLTIATNNVKSHGGILYVSSESGAGTSFIFEIPKDGGLSNG